MSIKGFLQAKEMQTGGMLQQSFTGPFANQSRRDPSGAEYIPPTYAPPKPRTITIDPITPTPTAPTAEEIAKLDPGTVGSHADYNYNVTDAIAGAAKAGMGPFTPAQIGMLEPEFAASLAATVQPETALSRMADATIGQAIPFTPEGRLGLSIGALTPGAVGLATQRGLTGETLTDQVSKASAAVTSFFSDSKPATTTPAATQQIAGTGQFGPLAPAPIGTPTTPASARQAIAAINQTPAAPAAPAAPTAAQTGAEMFDTFGMGGEISPNFAIGGKGSFTSFAHYGAGVSQADEITIVQSARPGVFSSAKAGKDVVDSLVAMGRNEKDIKTIVGQMNPEQMQGRPETAPSIDADVGFGDSASVSDFSDYSDMGSDAEAPTFSSIGLD